MFKNKNTLFYIILIIIILIGILYFIKKNQVENFISTKDLSRQKAIKELRNKIDQKNNKIYDLQVMVEDRDNIIDQVQDSVKDDDILS